MSDEGELLQLVHGGFVVSSLPRGAHLGGGRCRSVQSRLSSTREDSYCICEGGNCCPEAQNVF